MGGAVIELGLAEPWEPEPSSRPRLPRRVPRWLLPGVVAVATLLALAAAAPHRRWDPVLSLRDANTALRFGPDDTLYVTTHRTRGARLRAYRPDRSGPLWTVNFAGAHPSPVIVGDPGLLTIAVFNTDPDGRGAGNEVQGRDARTGQLLWSRTDMGLLGVVDDLAVLTDREEGGGPVPGPTAANRLRGDGATAAPGRIEVVDRRTGRPRSTRTVPPDVLVGWTGSTELISELALDGRLRFVDPSTDDVRREVRLALIGLPMQVEVTGGHVDVLQESDGPSPRHFVTYDLATGAERRRQEGQLASSCGDRYLCRFEPGKLTVTDPATGAVRYDGPADRHVLRGDRLIVSSSITPAGTSVYDLRSGRRVHALPNWQVVGAGEDATLVVQALSGSSFLVGTLDHATGQVRVVGRGADWSGAAYCSRGRRHVGCFGVTGVRVWRHPR